MHLESNLILRNVDMRCSEWAVPGGQLTVLGSTESPFFLLKRPSDVLSLIDKRSGRYAAVIFESNGSYVGREVLCLHLVQSTVWWARRGPWGGTAGGGNYSAEWLAWGAEWGQPLPGSMGAGDRCSLVPVWGTGLTGKQAWAWMWFLAPVHCGQGFFFLYFELNFFAKSKVVYSAFCHETLLSCHCVWV